MKRPGDKNVRCTILLLLDYQPLQFKLDQRLARLLGVHTQTRPVIISALWQYIKTHKLQDTHEREYVNCDPFLRQIFQAERMKFAEIPQRLNPLLHPPDPIVSPMQKNFVWCTFLETVEKCIAELTKKRISSQNVLEKSLKDKWCGKGEESRPDYICISKTLIESFQVHSPILSPLFYTWMNMLLQILILFLQGLLR